MIRITASASLWAELLTAWGARLRALPDAVHPGWLAPLGEFSHVARWQDWAAFLGLGPITLAELGDAVLRLVLLPPGQARRALLLRGLWARSSQVRRCIDPATRAALVAEIGHPAWRALTLEMDVAALHVVSQRSAEAPLPDVDALAWEGWRAFAAAPHWQPDGALARLWRLQLPPQMPQMLEVPKVPEVPKKSAPATAALPDFEAQQWVLRRLTVDLREPPSWCTCAGPNWVLNWA